LNELSTRLLQLAEEGRETELRLRELGEATDARIKATDAHLKALGEATDARIAALVSAIGEHVRQGHPQG
jgi:hypothetical protein